MGWTIPALLLMSILATSSLDSKAEGYDIWPVGKLPIDKDSLKKGIDRSTEIADQKIITFLTFQEEDAEQAMNFYIGLFDNSEIISLKRWGKDAPGKEGTIMQATFTISGRMFMCSDSPPIHDWDFTPAVSNYVECEDESELEHLFARLAENGEVAMPLNNYGFSQKFGWVIDKFGISWQLNLR